VSPSHADAAPAAPQAAAEPEAAPDPAPAATGHAVATAPPTQYQDTNVAAPVAGNNTVENAPQASHTEQPPTQPDASPTWTWNWDWNCADASAGDWQLNSPAPDGTGPATWIWNWIWNCAAGTGNTAVSIRVLSPGDNGPVTQANGGASGGAGGIAPDPGAALPPVPVPAPVPGDAPASPVGSEPSSAEPGLPVSLDDVLTAFESPPQAQKRYRYDAMPADLAAGVLRDLAPAPPSSLSSLSGEAALVAGSIVPVVDRVVGEAVSPSPPPPPGLADAAAAVAAAVAVVSGPQAAGTVLRLVQPDPARASAPSVARRAREGLGVAGLHRLASGPSLSAVLPSDERAPKARPASARATSAGGSSGPHIPIRIPDPFPVGAFGSSGAPERAPTPPSGLALLAVLLFALTCSAPGIARVVPVSHDRPRVRPRPRRPDKPG
jgi:hypothetical protein